MYDIFRFSRASLLAATLATAAIFSAPASAVTIQINDGSGTFSCSLNSLNVLSSGNVSASVASCSPALAGAQTGGGETGGGETGGGETGGGETGGGETGGSPVGGGGDPGSGLWRASSQNGSVVYVADQSLSGGNPTTVSRLPGCINGGSIDNSSACTSRSSYAGVIDGQSVSVKLTQGQILSIRFLPSGVPQRSLSGTLKLTNSVGGNVGMTTKMWLSTTPGLDDLKVTRCTSQTNGTPTVGVGSSYCPVTDASKVYYLNIAPSATCNDCTWRLEESSGLDVFKR